VNAACATLHHSWHSRDPRLLPESHLPLLVGWEEEEEEGLIKLYPAHRSGRELEVAGSFSGA